VAILRKIKDCLKYEIWWIKQICLFLVYNLILNILNSCYANIYSFNFHLRIRNRTSLFWGRNIKSH
jgi:hypothetical protein